MIVKHRLIGYDRQTDRQAVRFDIDAGLMDRAKRLAHVPEDDPEAVWSYPLSRDQVSDLAELMGAEIDPDRAEFFLEAFSVTSPPRMPTD